MAYVKCRGLEREGRLVPVGDIKYDECHVRSG